MNNTLLLKIRDASPASLVRRMRSLIAVGMAASSCLWTSTIRAEESEKTPPPTDTQLRASVATMAKEFALQSQFTLGEGAGTKLTLHPEPILRWSNPTAGSVFGDVYLWTDQGRPAAVVSWYRFFVPKWGRTLEVSSLSEKSLTGTADGVNFWAPQAAGLTLAPLPEVDAPAKAMSARMTQMRRLAGEFSAHLTDTRGGVEGVRRQLRLLPQPVYRYPAGNNSKSPAVDGAMFAFVEGTDPEVFLVIEATRKNDAPQWHFGMARMNRDAMRGTFRDKVVWSVPHLKNPIDAPREPYSLFSLEHPLKDSANSRN